MKFTIIFVIFILIFYIGITNAQVYYVDVPDNYNSYPGVYGLHTTDENSEQASRDLDVTFLAGDSPEYVDTNNIIYPSKKNYVSSVLPVVNLIHKNDGPSYLYKKQPEVPISRKIIYRGDSSIVGEGKKNGNFVKSNNERRGEVVLELHVTVNND